MSSERLPEVGEAEARGPTAALFTEIKAANGVPMVALIYRHLATIPGALGWAWTILGPAIRAPATSEAAERLISLPLDVSLSRLGAPGAARLGLGAVDRAAILYILTAYNSANTRNLIAARGLRRLLDHDAAVDAAGADARAASVGAEAGAGYPTLPPLIGLEAMAAPLRARLEALIGADTRLVPSLYRHLGHWPDFLSEMAARLAGPAADGRLLAAADAVSGAADAVVAELVDDLRARDGAAGRPAGEVRDTLRATLDSFAAVIPEMIVVGRLMRDALDGSDENP